MPQVGDRELARREVGEQVEHVLERAFGLAGTQHEKLGIEALECLVELFLPLDPHHELDSVVQLDVVVTGRNDAGITCHSREADDRQGAGLAKSPDEGVLGEERLRPGRLGALGLLEVAYGDDERDPITLGNGLAQTSRARHSVECTRAATVRTVWGRVAIALLLVALPAVANAAARPAIIGTARADSLVGLEGSDRIVARGGNDRIAAEYDGGFDDVSCGPGRDIVAADLRDRVRADCEIVSRRIHRDRHANPESQHESEVEPDSLTVGATTVALFQVGRNRSGGAASIGFATTTDGGRTWREGILPGLTAQSPRPGPSVRASDPVLAYDAAHGVWLASTLALAPGVTRLTIHRSTDGLTWTGPIDATVAQSAELAYDKNWIACDNGAASPFRGRCYLAYTLIGDRVDDVAVQRSDDGGRTWSAAVTRRLPVTGVLPVVQPEGRLVLTFWSGRTGMVSITSQDGGVTLDEPVLISELTARDARPLRAPPLIASDVDRDGVVLTTWQDCRFRPGCAANDVVISRSVDGKTWTPPARVTSGRHVVMPTIGVEPGSGRLAIAYYAIHQNGIDAEVVTSADGTRWSAPQRLNPRRMPLAWMPQTTLGRMLADYIGVSWVRGRPLVIFALASPPRNGELRQAIYAARG